MQKRHDSYRKYNIVKKADGCACRIGEFKADSDVDQDAKKGDAKPDDRVVRIVLDIWPLIEDQL